MDAVSIPYNFTGAGQVQTQSGGIGLFRGLVAAETGGTNPVTVRLYDNTSGSGALLASVTIAAGGSVDIDLSFARRILTGIYATVSGTGTLAATAWVG